MWLDTEQIASLAAALLLLKAHAIRAANVTYWNNITIFPIECPEGSRWTEWTDDFVTGSTRIENPYDEWISARGKPGVHDGTGLPLKLQKETGANDTALLSAAEWRPPVYAKIDIQSTGAPGIPSTFNFRRDSVPGWKEIDFIIATIETDSGAFKSFISTPLWLATDDGTLRKAKTIGELREVDVILAEGTEFATDISKHNDNFVGINPEAAFDQTWAMTWKDFQPFKDYHTYAMSWHPNTIAWYAGEKNKASLRVTLNQKVNDDKIFPTKGPFPIRLGPWEAAGDWAGEVDWQKYPEPIMKVSQVEISGCRVINKDFDEKMKAQSPSWK